MKFLSLVFSIVILFLAVKPGIDFFSFKAENEQVCCEGKCNPFENTEKPSGQENQNDQSQRKSCNPFQSCCMWVSNYMTKTSKEEINPEILSKQNLNYQSAFPFQIATDFWQPPKIA